MAAGQRPSAGRVVGEVPRLDPEAADDPGHQVVERRERVEEVPDRPDEGRQHGDADPAVDPQEQRRHVADALAADDALGDDPGPADEPDRAQAEPDGGRRQMAGVGQVRALGADVADEDEDERQRDGRRGPDEVDGQRQTARVGGVEGVGEGRGRRRQSERRQADGGDADAAESTGHGRGSRGGRPPAPAEQDATGHGDEGQAGEDRQEDAALVAARGVGIRRRGRSGIGARGRRHRRRRRGGRRAGRRGRSGRDRGGARTRRR